MVQFRVREFLFLSTVSYVPGYTTPYKVTYPWHSTAYGFDYPTCSLWWGELLEPECRCIFSAFLIPYKLARSWHKSYFLTTGTTIFSNPHLLFKPR